MAAILAPPYRIPPVDDAEAALPVFSVQLKSRGDGTPGRKPSTYKITVFTDGEGTYWHKQPRADHYRDYCDPHWPNVRWQTAADLERQGLTPDAKRDTHPRFAGSDSATRMARFEVQDRALRVTAVHCDEIHLHANDKWDAKTRYAKLFGIRLAETTSEFTIEDVEPAKPKPKARARKAKK